MRILPISVTLLLVASTGVAAQQQQKTAPPSAPPQRRQSQPQMGPTPGPGADTLAEAKNPFRDDLAALREGRRLFNWYNCSGCHGDHAGGGMGPSLRDSTWVYGATDARIFNSIYQGRTKGMPAWGGKLPDDQIWKIVAYIKSLRTAREPDRP